MVTGEDPSEKHENLATGFRPLALSAQQRKVYDILLEFSQGNHQYARWYLGALTVLRLNVPDCFAQAANSIREITEKLPQQLGVVVPASPVPAAQAAVATLLELKTRKYADGWHGATIESSLAEALEKLETMRERLNAPGRKKVFMTALELRDPHRSLSSPKLRQMRERHFDRLNNFFQKVTHHGIVPDHADFESNLSSFEELIITYLSPVTASQLDVVVDIIEASPSPESKERLDRLLFNNTANQLLLLHQLDNPEWLPYLEELEWFKKPRDGEQTEDGLIVFRQDPALSCLARFAESSAADVLRILEKLPPTENPQVPDQVALCIARIADRALIPRCLKLLRRVLSKSGTTECVWIEEVLKTWIRIGSFEESITLIEGYAKLLMQHNTERDEAEGRSWQMGEIDGNFSAILGTQRPMLMAGAIFRMLIFWKEGRKKRANEPWLDELFSDSESPERRDPPTFLLEDFRVRNSLSDSFEEIFASRLFEISSSIFRGGDDVLIEELDQLLNSDSWELFARLRRQLYADHPAKTGEKARNDILGKLSGLARYAGSHGFEMAQMLKVHSERYGFAFLSQSEVEQFVEKVMEGPLDREGKLVTEEPYITTFRRKQLEPIRTLLTGPALVVYRSMAADFPDLPISCYKPYSKGQGARFVQHTAPKEAENMESMTDVDLWQLLNTWVPIMESRSSDDWWVRQDVGSLGIAFSQLIESQPSRFLVSTAWWRKINRPEILNKLLERGITRFEKPATDNGTELALTDDDWRIWFGLAAWISELSKVSNSQDTSAQDATRAMDNEWNSPRKTVVKFLGEALESEQSIPDDLRSLIGPLLLGFTEEPDPQLVGVDEPSLGDWLTTAINSVQGAAMERLLVFALKQQKVRPTVGPDAWIFEAIHAILSDARQSPAIFAIIGYRCNLAMFLYGEQFKQEPTLLLPPERHHQRNAFIESQIVYGSPVGKLIEVLPSFPGYALDLLKEMNQSDTRIHDQRRSVGDQLGFSLLFYYWNGCYPDPGTALEIVDRYFDLARPEQRGKTIGDVARCFSDATETSSDAQLFQLVREFWERRALAIEESRKSGRYSADEVYDELCSFLTWLGCGCQPFDWTTHQVLNAIRHLEKPPRAAFIMRTLDSLSGDPGKLESCTRIVEALVSKESSFQAWSFREKNLKPILWRGINSGDAAVERRVRQIQEVLLRNGLFEYRVLDS